MNTLSRNIGAMEGALLEHVLPQLTDSFARGQVYGVIYMLRHMALHVDWSKAPLQAQIERIRALETELSRLGAVTGRPAIPIELQVHDAQACVRSGTELKQLRDAGCAWLDLLVKWHFRTRDALDIILARQTGEALHACVTDINRMEAKRTPPPMFAQIATGREPNQAEPAL